MNRKPAKQIKPRQRGSLELLCLSALFSAICFVLTAYLHIPTNNGITHIGDGIIFLAASILPLPYAVGAGIVGASLADLLSGFPVWAPATIVIKGITVCLFTRKSDRIITIRNLVALLPAFVVCAAGYTFYEALVISNFATAVTAIPSYAVQTGASAALYIFAGTALDRLGFKKIFLKDD